MSIFIYYIYAYLREDGTPYYIGKGKEDRAYSSNHYMSVPKDKSKIVFLETNLSEIGALALERRYISWYGRKDNNTGILRNLTDGGEGASGAIRSAETKNKIRIANMKENLSKETRKKRSDAVRGEKNPVYGKRWTNSLESRKKISEARKAYWRRIKGKTTI